MSDMPIILHLLFATIATIGFAVFFNTPPNALIPSGLTGGIGWTIYVYIVKFTGNAIFANFVAAGFVSLTSEILARKLKHPATLFVIPGIIPLVPGLGMYNTVLYLTQKNFELGISTGVDTIFIGIAISLGVLVMTSLARTFSLVKIRKHLK
jgi:uncharacterized membrane protein YjjB (DUF3815 family)